MRDRKERRVTRVITVAAASPHAACTRGLSVYLFAYIYLHAAPGCTAGAAEDSKTIISAKGEPTRSVATAK